MKEIKVYGIDSSNIYDDIELLCLQDHKLTDAQFIEIAEEQGNIWSLKGYELAHNIDDIPHTMYIRFINN